MKKSDPKCSNYIQYVQTIAQEDAQGLQKSQEDYGNSWKKRGGVGAYMMLARKWDRIENRCAEVPQGQDSGNYDVFAHLAADKREEGMLDDIRDLRRYLLLVEAELRSMNDEEVGSGVALTPPPTAPVPEKPKKKKKKKLKIPTIPIGEKCEEGMWSPCYVSEENGELEVEPPQPDTEPELEPEHPVLELR